MQRQESRHCIVSLLLIIFEDDTRFDFRALQFVSITLGFAFKFIRTKYNSIPATVFTFTNHAAQPLESNIRFTLLRLLHRFKRATLHHIRNF